MCIYVHMKGWTYCPRIAARFCAKDWLEGVPDGGFAAPRWLPGGVGCLATPGAPGGVANLLAAIFSESDFDMLLATEPLGEGGRALSDGTGGGAGTVPCVVEPKDWPILGVPKPLGGVFDDLRAPGSSDCPPAVPRLLEGRPLGGVFIPGKPGNPREKSKGFMPDGILCAGDAPTGGALPTGKLTPPGNEGRAVPPAVPGGVSVEPPASGGRKAGLGLLPSSGGLNASNGGGPNPIDFGGGGGGGTAGFFGATVGT
mmetsp:Transcript_44902/g.70022  ORF Transcript_44902/g.70022 Transcript_44902/m.70022 type:complete len:256 (+) Transcript_44902:3-770(+)